MLDRSLQNLVMDYVDLYIYHMWDYQTPFYDVLEGLANGEGGKSPIYRHFKLLCVAACKGECPCGKGRVFPKFVSVQGHYNLIFREEEREMTPFCYEDNIALTPYSAIESGRLSRKPGEVSKRLREDSYAKFK